MSNRKRFAALAKTFHAIAYAPVFDKYDLIDLRKLDDWAVAMDPDGSDGVRCTAAFILNLWSTREPWKCGKFDVFDALGQWDDDHTAAFREWISNPWRP